MQEHSFSELGNHPIQILLPITPYCTPTKPLTTTYDIHQAPPLPHCCHIFPLRYSNSNNCSATRAHRPMGGCSHKQPAGKHALAARIVAQRSASPSCAMVRAGHRRMVFHVQEVCSMDAWPSRSMSRVEPSFREITLHNLESLIYKPNLIVIQLHCFSMKEISPSSERTLHQGSTRSHPPDIVL